MTSRYGRDPCPLGRLMLLLTIARPLDDLLTLSFTPGVGASQRCHRRRRDFGCRVCPGVTILLETNKTTRHCTGPHPASCRGAVCRSTPTVRQRKVIEGGHSNPYRHSPSSYPSPAGGEGTSPAGCACSQLSCFVQTKKSVGNTSKCPPPKAC